MQNSINDDVVVSSRIRLARNLKNEKFPIKMTPDEAQAVVEKIKNAVLDSNTTLANDYTFFKMKDIPDIEQNVLIEKHLISPALSKNEDMSAFMLSKDEKSTIMINEEDHIRLQVLGNGLCLDKCWDKADKIDDVLEEKLEYAFDNELGYITSCPTNLGTGMRASVMLHLPALALTNQIEKVLLAVSQIGIAVRGVYGEGTKSMGDLFQISNQGTLGASEQTLIDRINQISMQIVEKERNTRKYLLENNKNYVENEIYRAYGLLKYSRILSTSEAMKLLSYLKLGVNLDIIKDMKNEDIDKLMIRVQANNISYEARENFSAKERDYKRAEILRNCI